MKNIKIADFYYLFIFILCFMNISNLPSKQNRFNKIKKNNNINSPIKTKREIKEKDNKYQKKLRLIYSEENKQLRKGEDSSDDDDFVPLKIYLDLYNFNWTYPNETLLAYKDKFYEAMLNATNLLEKFIYISTDINADAHYDNQNREEWELEFWNKLKDNRKNNKNFIFNI